MALIWNWEFQSMSSRFGFRNVSTSFDNEMLWLANETLNQNEQRIFRFSIWQKGRRLLRVTLIYKIRRGEHLNNSKHWQIVVEILNILIRLDFNTPKWIHLQKDTIRDPNWWDWEPFLLLEWCRSIQIAHATSFWRAIRVKILESQSVRWS